MHALPAITEAKDQINNIKGDNYISEEAFLNLEEKFKAYIGSSGQSDEEVDMDEEESCSDMFDNDDEKYIVYVDQIRVLLSKPYTQYRHDMLKSMLTEISKELKKCESMGVKVESKIKKFNDLNQLYKEWKAFTRKLRWKNTSIWKSRKFFISRN